MHGIWQRTLVVSEPCSVAPPFRPGVDYVEAPLEEIPQKVEYYLSTPEGLVEAKGIIDQAYRTLVNECKLTRTLQQLMGSPAVQQAKL